MVSMMQLKTLILSNVNYKEIDIKANGHTFMLADNNTATN